MTSIFFRAAILAAILIASTAVSAEESRKAALGRDLQTFTQYNTMLIEKYNSDSDLMLRIDDLDALIDEYRAGSLSADELRGESRRRATAIESDIHLLEAELEAMPLLPTSSLPETQGLAKAVAAFRAYVKEMPESLRQHLKLIEQSSAAVLAGDETRYQALLREQFKFLADQVDGETAVLRVQVELIDPKSFIAPLQHCVMHHNNAWSALLRSWADAEEIDLTAAIEVMAEHLEKADLARRNGERRLDRQETAYKLRDNLVGNPKSEAKEMTSLFANLRLSYDNERQLVEITRKFGEAVSNAGSAEVESADSFENFWVEVSALINRRMELAVERQMIAGRIGAAMQ